MKEIIEKVLEEKMNDGTVEKIIGEKLDKMLSSTMDDMLGWNSPIKKALEEKLKPIMLNAVEKSNVSDYAVKVTALLNDLLKNTQLTSYKNSIKNLKGFLDIDVTYGQKVKLSDIFEKYCEFIEKDAFTESDFESTEINRDDGVKNVWVECYMQAEKKEEGYFTQTKKYSVELSNQKSDEPKSRFRKTAFNFEIRHSSYDSKNHIGLGLDVSIDEIHHLPAFVLYLIKLSNNYADIEIDTEEASDEVSIEFEWNVD